MSRLSDVINRAIDEVRDPRGAVDIHAAAAFSRPLLDEEDCEYLISEALCKRIKHLAQKSGKAIEDAASLAPTEMLFPDLRPAYAIDIEGSIVKATDSLSMLEFRRLISIREKQAADDLAHLDVLRFAFTRVSALWSANPEWTFGQVCSAHRSVA